jgi:hypothetical protein
VTIIDKNDRETTVCERTELLRDAASILRERGRRVLSARIFSACGGMRDASDSVVVLDTADVDAVATAVRAADGR